MNRHKNKKNVVPIDELPNNIQAIFDEIAERLWNNHATIMIGSGFSKNSDKGKQFPDWSELGDLFYEKLNGHKPKQGVKYQSVLKLAEEVQAEYERPVLDRLLRNAIPYETATPSSLHSDLLDLPWEDVFTTNYDNLLETALDKVNYRKYHIVTDKTELLHSEKPRIVKLHGSFPSSRPFIITEEDYRTYPQKFAPFVNTVRQSLIENTLCLIGFSGDDPNFLSWIGWIRDNLGQENSHKIYLIGANDITTAQEKLLAKRNIVNVNCNNTGNHSMAIGQFIKYLKSAKKKYDKLNWPDKTKFLIKQNGEKENQLEDVLVEWVKVRESYPNWIIAPRDVRSNLWAATQFWLNHLSSTKDLNDEMILVFAYELNWRLNKCLIPIFNENAKVFEGLIDKYNIKNNNNFCLEEKYFNGKMLSEMLLSIQLSMLRFYREEHDCDKWNELNNNIKLVYSPQEDNNEYHYEQVLQSIFLLDINKTKEKLTAWPDTASFSYWNVRKAMLWAEFGDIKKAEVILDDSLKSLRRLLNLGMRINDYSLVSQEANIMLLIKYVKNAKGFFSRSESSLATRDELKKMEELFNKQEEKDDDNDVNIATVDYVSNYINMKFEYIKDHKENEAKNEYDSLLRKVRQIKKDDLFFQFKEQWDLLKQYKCDPWTELEVFQAKLNPTPEELKSTSTVNEFDIGESKVTNHMRNYDEEALAAYQFLRFTELTGFSIRIFNSNLSSKSAQGAIQRIYKYSPLWAITTFIRIGDVKLTNLVFSRQSLLKYTTEDVDTFIDSYLQAIENAESEIINGSDLYNDNFGITLARIIPEILSRLSCKCSYKKRIELLHFLKKIYGSEHKNKYKNINSLIKRCLSTFTQKELYKLIPMILEIPFPQGMNIIIEREFVNPFFFIYLNKNDVKYYNKITINNDQIKKLFDLAASQKELERKWGTFSLIRLYQFDLLTTSQINKLGRTIWSQVDENGFPKDTHFYNFAFLKLPHPQKKNPEILMKNYIRNSQFPIQGTQKSISGYSGNIPLCQNIIGAIESIEFNQNELLNIFKRLIQWWDSDKLHLKKEDSVLFSEKGEFTARFRRLREVLTSILPKFDLSADISVDVKKIVKEFDEYELPTNEIKIAGRKFLEIEFDELIPNIKRALSSFERNIVIDALEAISIFTEESQKPSKDIEHLISILSEKIYWGHSVAISSCINTMRLLILRKPRLINSSIEILFQKTLISSKSLALLSMEIPEDEFAQKIEIRQKAAALAYQYYIYLKNKKKAIPEIVKQWKAICSAKDEFLEIKAKYEL